MLTIKSLHIVFVVTWFAAIFYLPRLFVYHSMSGDSAVHAQLQIMERKLYWGIATPSAALTLILGLWLIWFFPAWLGQLWLWLKLALVLLLLIYHLWCMKLMIRLRTEPRCRSHIWFRWFNEFPVLILIGAVFLVEFKPV